MPKTIGIDCRFAATKSGLGRYTRELVTHLLKRNDPIRYILFLRDADESWLKTLKSSNEQRVTSNVSHYSLQEQVKFPRLIKDAHIDLLFSPHFNVPLFCPVPFIVTIHDLILHRYPNDASGIKQAAYKFLFGNAVKKSQLIIAVSRFTADEISSVYGNDLRSKIHVIHEGVWESFQRRSEAECRPVLEKYKIGKPFFLYVGNAKQHKNVQMLIDAFAALNDKETELILVTGGKEASRLHAKDHVRLLPDVPEEDLPAFYSSAKAFVTASLYEGFCLPVAEAENCGCPVIATKCGAIPEIASSSAMLMEPTVENLRSAMMHVPSPAHASKKWSWDAAAEATVRLFE